VNGYTVEEVAAIPRFNKEQLLETIDDGYIVVRRMLRETPIVDLTDPAPGFEMRYSKSQVISMALAGQRTPLGRGLCLESDVGKDLWIEDGAILRGCNACTWM
jgi:hypothetical protein